MSHQRNDLKAGIFILVSVALIVAVIVGIKGLGTFLEPRVERTVRFALRDDVGGLGVGDPVRLGGVRVGSVEAIDFEPAAATGADDGDTGQPAIAIAFSMPRRFEVREGARVVVQTTVTGTSVLNIDDLGGGRVLEPGEPLVGRASGLAALLAGLGDAGPALVNDLRTVTIPKVNAAVDGFRDTGPAATALVRRVDAKVDPVVDEYNRFMNRGTEMAGNISDVFGDTKADFRTTMSNLSAATGTVREKLPPVMDKLDGGLAKVNESLDAARGALEDVNRTMENAREATAAVRGILARNRGRIDGMVASLKAAGDNLKHATAEVRRSPWRLLYKPGTNEVANLNLYDAARQFADGAAELNDAATALRDAAGDDQTSPEQLQRLVDRLTETFGEFEQVEQKLWESVR